MSERVKRRRGRPKAKHRTEPVHIRVAVPALAAYDTQSALTQIPVGTLIRRVIEQHAPVIFRGPKIPETP